MANGALRSAVAGRGRELGPRHQPVPVLHGHVPATAELGFVPLSLLREEGLGIGGGSAVERCVVLLRRSPWKFTVGFRGFVGRRPIGGPLVLVPEALERRPRFDQRPVDGEVLGREQAGRPGLRDHVRENIRAICCVSNRSRFLLNVLASPTGSSALSPTNQRERRL